MSWRRASSSKPTCAASSPFALSCFGTRNWRGDRHLLVQRVAGEVDDLHPVAQRRRDRVQHVRRGDEHHLREVVLDVQVVVDEGVVLLRVEHLEQRRRRVAAEVHRHLVDFVEQEDRVDRAGLLHHLDDLAGEGADVGAAVAADLGLVAHAAEREADELAVRRRGRSSSRATSCRRPEGRRSRGSSAGVSVVSWRTARNSRIRSLTFSRP